MIVDLRHGLAAGAMSDPDCGSVGVLIAKIFAKTFDDLRFPRRFRFPADSDGIEVHIYKYGRIHGAIRIFSENLFRNVVNLIRRDINPQCNDMGVWNV